MSSPTGTPTASPSALVEVEPESETRDHVQAVYLAIFVCVLALVLGLLAAHGLRRLRVHFLSEASVLLVVGVLVGALIHLDSGERVVHGVEQITLFDGEVLFILLLPPIIFDSGFRSSLDSFFNNIGGICVLAFAGTFSATAMTGLLVYGGGQLEWIYQTSAVEALSFGSLVSATDPVTILSTLHSLGVDPTLYSLVFGESVLNDAVAIASFNTVVNFEEEPVSVMLVLRGIGKFLEIFLGSFGIGVLVGCLSAVLLQRGVLLNVESNIVNHSHLVRSDHSHSRSGGQRSRHWGSKTNDAANGTRSIDSDSETEINMHHDNDDSDDIIVNEIDADADSDSGNDNSNVTSTTVDDDDVVHVDAESPARVQVTVLALMPYLSYCLAEYLRLSGIVSILFCGFTMSKYAKLYMGKVS
jgi:NhaP-type Na+/H+ or K+/H+ antiporter